MESKLAHIIELARAVEYADCQISALQATNAELHSLVKRQEALDTAVEEFLKEYDTQP